MLNIVLFEPEIPPNTGNIIRLCANTGAHLHLIHPLGFKLDDKRLKRAGLDYDEFARISNYASLDEFIRQNGAEKSIYAVSTKGSRCYTDIRYRYGDIILFGPETRGLPRPVLAQFAEDNILKIPMQSGSRSLNLSNAVAVIAYEAWRQNNFTRDS